LTGHTDERGTREYNMALGERRAKAVESFLITNGVNPQQLEAVSYGKEALSIRDMMKQRGKKIVA
jgi:peptidoglycan-associated lipoprotein